MTRPSAVPASPAFDGIARGAQFRDRIAIVVQAPPAAIFQAFMGTLVHWEEPCLPSHHTL
jgi:hypothetical protein